MWFCLQKLWKSITVLIDTFFGFYWFSHGKIPGLSSKIHLRRLLLSGRWNQSDTCVMFTISSLPITVLCPKWLISITNVKTGVCIYYKTRFTGHQLMSLFPSEEKEKEIDSKCHYYKVISTVFLCYGQVVCNWGRRTVEYFFVYTKPNYLYVLTMVK